MLQYVCDTCAAVREGLDTSWIVGFATESVGVTAARSELSFLPQWDEDQAVRWLAVHFCCEACKAAYTAALLVELPEEPEVEETNVEVAPVRTAKKTMRVERAATPLRTTSRTSSRTSMKRSARKPTPARAKQKRRAS